jgi:hypothetical protein
MQSVEQNPIVISGDSAMRKIHWADIALPFLAFAALWLTTPPTAASVNACVPFQPAVAGKKPLPLGVNASLARSSRLCRQVPLRTAQ